MAKLVTMKDIANALHISTVSVSKALSGKEGVSDEVREQIIIKAEEMGYHYHSGPNSKGNISEGGFSIGIIIAKHFVETDDSSFYSKMSNYVIMDLSHRGCFGILEIVRKEDEEACNVPALITNNKVDGLIVLGQFSNKYIEMIVDRHLPVTFLDFYTEKVSIDSIVSDNTYGAYLLTKHIIKNGHRNIGFVGDIFSTSSILDRYLGYYKALIENGIEVRKEWVLKDRDSDGVYSEIVFPEDMPTAFVCNCDQVAYEVVKRLKKKGYRVPEDISVVGFDDHIYSTLSNPPLTTFSCDMPTMAETAVESVMHRISGETFIPGRKVISGKLIVRESVKNIKTEGDEQ
ncbi:MAG: LacI family DNA-binding transcriptional regulator [Lachnospiraceae bacterium]|nr:LacI family DNA-binding transcriptional regulator [Lachnospiraceae bacterium]